MQYVPVGQMKARLRTTTREQSLGEWFQEEPPRVWFEDTSRLDYNEIFQPKGERESYNRLSIEAWSWEDVRIKKESQYLTKASAVDALQHEALTHYGL